MGAARQALADELNIEARQVQVWFQNKRQKTKRNGEPRPATAHPRSVTSAPPLGIPMNNTFHFPSSVEQQQHSRLLERVLSATTQVNSPNQHSSPNEHQHSSRIGGPVAKRS